ncbi:Drug/Metabolite Transporter (DMT) Superfamily [Thraustotheca clavata]|uniref:Drug/Metabolite Transporter (DMT) Superfamily n=1 Tax=Thraustotheca clavata TaxID=74557 RepID=A0A1W0A9D5_9STRA|nr:Drug/Metabolite Transporter (DMT) Superfamily [Thraustotheca clavata]
MPETKSTAPNRSTLMLIYCFLGVMATFTLNGVLLEKLTTKHEVGEMTLTFVSCSIFAGVAQVLRYICKEPTSKMPLPKYLILASLTFASTIASIYALRYVSFITRILGKSCKSIPVMVLGLCYGKRYVFKKCFSVVLLSLGVAYFLYGTYEQSHPHQSKQEHLGLGFGCFLLLVSLLCDGATGAMEDKVIEVYNIHAFELMFYLSLFKALYALVGIIVCGELSTVPATVPHLGNLFLLSLTGASGQACLFVTLRAFGALTTSIIGTMRKVVSIVLSAVLFNHTLDGDQKLGLVIAFVAIGLNWLPNSKASRSNPMPTEKDEVDSLLSDTTGDEEDDESGEDSCILTVEECHKLDAVVEWEKQSSVIMVA